MAVFSVEDREIKRSGISGKFDFFGVRDFLVRLCALKRARKVDFEKWYKSRAFSSFSGEMHFHGKGLSMCRKFCAFSRKRRENVNV